MKKAAIITALCVVAAWWLWAPQRYANHDYAYLDNEGFEFQSIPEGVVIVTNRVDGWEVSGPIGLRREGSNTFVMLPYGSWIAQRFQVAKGDHIEVSNMFSIIDSIGDAPRWLIGDHRFKSTKRNVSYGIKNIEPGKIYCVASVRVRRANHHRYGTRLVYTEIVHPEFGWIRKGVGDFERVGYGRHSGGPLIDDVSVMAVE